MNWNRIKHPTHTLNKDPEVEKLLRALMEKNVFPILTVELDLDENDEPKDDSQVGLTCYGQAEWIATNIFQAVENHPEIKLILGKLAAITMLKERLLGPLEDELKRRQSSQEGVDLFDLSKYDVDKNKPN